MPIKRKKDKHLPKRMHFKHGSYYYVNRDNKWIKIGKTLHEAMIKWVEIVQPDEKACHTMEQLFNRYMLEISIKKAKSSYQSDQQAMKALHIAFAHLSPRVVNQVLIYEFLDTRGAVAPTRANREKALLSHVFTKAIRWGVVTENPCRGVENLDEFGRDRYVEDHELLAVHSIANENMQNIIDFALVTGLRQADIIKIKLSDLNEKGIFITVQKSRKSKKSKVVN